MFKKTDTHPSNGKRHFDTRVLTAMAIMAAVSVVLARLIIPMPNATTRFSIEAVPIILTGYLFGPVPGMLVGFVADAVGTLFSGYGYNPFFCVPPILYGLIPALLRGLIREKTSWWRILLTILPAALLGSVLWQSYWLSYFYGSATFSAFLASRAVQHGVTALVNAFVLWALFRAGVFRQLHLWPYAKGTEQTLKYRQARS